MNLTVIDAETRCCAVYGHPIRHSASPAMQNAGFNALGLNWRYLAFDVPPEQLPAAVTGAGAMRFIGLNLTVPHKLLALRLVDVLDETAATWGAVNTILFEGKTPSGEWQPLRLCKDPEVLAVRSRGFNTDADAIIRALRDDLNLEPRRASVLLLGAGGAGRVAALRLAAEGVSSLFLHNRNASKAAEVAREISQRFPGVKTEVGCPPDTVDLILNATSLGLKETDPTPLPAETFSLGKTAAVYDMIYRPAQTKLLAAAEQAGRRTANGLGMLLYQGAKAMEIWTGQTAPVPVMRQALEQAIYS